MNHAIIVAAGSGTRLSTGKNKAFVELLGKPLLVYTLETFQKCNVIDTITIVTKEENKAEAENLVETYALSKVKQIINGGKERQDSVYCGLQAIAQYSQPEDYVVIHNSSNIFVRELEIENCITGAHETDAAVVGWRVKDTLKKSSENNGTEYTENTISREGLWQVQTPQVVRYDLALQAFEQAQKEPFYGTDDVQLVERMGTKVKLVECSTENFKITTPKDLELAEKLLLSKVSKEFRTGFGHDSHRFTEQGKPLVLGGIIIQNHKGLEANSDGDVVLHAVFNALSQSIGGTSLGYYCDELCKQGITDSKEYIKLVMKMLIEKGYNLNNVGISLECATPKIAPYVDEMKKSLSALLNLDEDRIGITATSGEGLTDFGKGLGIQCFAVVSVVNKKGGEQ